MLSVIARKAIYSDGGLLVASSGQAGLAQKKPKPRDISHCGKLLVTFSGRTRAYWCNPECFNLTEEQDISAYTGTRLSFDPFESSVKFPVFAGAKTFHFGQNLRAFRRARGLSQAKLANKMELKGLETAQSTICFREKTPDNPSGEFVRAAAEVLGIPPFAFFINLKQPHGYRRLAKFLDGVSSSVCEA